MNNYRTFYDAISDLQQYLGIGNSDYLKVGVKQANDNGFPEAAAWLQAWDAHFKLCIEEEFNVGDSKTRVCSEGGPNCFCRADGVR